MVCPRVNLRKYCHFEIPDIQTGLSMPDFVVVAFAVTLGQEILLGPGVIHSKSRFSAVGEQGWVQT